MADRATATALSAHLIRRAERLLMETKKSAAARIDAAEPILRMEEMLLLMLEQQMLIVEIGDDSIFG